MSEEIVTPGIDQQIEFIKDLRELADNNAEINILPLPQEVNMLRAIEENLTAVKRWNQAHEASKMEEGAIDKAALLLRTDFLFRLVLSIETACYSNGFTREKTDEFMGAVATVGSTVIHYTRRTNVVVRSRDEYANAKGISQVIVDSFNALKFKIIAGLKGCQPAEFFSVQEDMIKTGITQLTDTLMELYTGNKGGIS